MFQIRRHQAFTLIELLIVVAIIAILAVIAVPNFLEAQTRAKVSRVRADMRNMATAMEAYVIDNNRYPIPSDNYGNFMTNPLTATLVSPFETRVPVLLTTPISYMSDRPEDPFAKVRFGESRLYHCITRQYVDIRHNNAPAYNWALIYTRFFREITGRPAPQPIEYFFVSWGPDKVHDANVPDVVAPVGPHVHGKGAVYDPTNGTISGGDIIYFGPGYGFAWQR
jgi:prepilin-type N-terminal cleavage/methylation domain-containing protein